MVDNDSEATRRRQWSCYGEDGWEWWVSDEVTEGYSLCVDGRDDGGRWSFDK